MLQAGRVTAGPRTTAEYQAALELEVWKDLQEKLFQEQVNGTLTIYENSQISGYLVKK